MSSVECMVPILVRFRDISFPPPLFSRILSFGLMQLYIGLSNCRSVMWHVMSKMGMKYIWMEWLDSQPSSNHRQTNLIRHKILLYDEYTICTQKLETPFLLATVARCQWTRFQGFEINPQTLNSAIFLGDWEKLTWAVCLVPSVRYTPILRWTSPNTNCYTQGRNVWM